MGDGPRNDDCEAASGEGAEDVGTAREVCRYQHPWEKAAFRARRVWHTCMDKGGIFVREKLI